MPVRGFKLNATTWDLSLDAGGRLEILNDDSDEAADAATAQEINTRLLFPRGEAFTDLGEGVPYYEEILIKGGDPARAEAIVRQTIGSVPSIVDVPVCRLSLDRATRKASVTWEARTSRGRTIRSADFPPLKVR